MIPTAALMLRVRNGSPTKAPAWRPVYSPSETWELWLDEVGRYVFLAAPQSSPKRHLIVDLNFSSGEVLGEFGEDQGAGQGIYPLQDIDIVLYANRLADFGDVILHAAGVAVDGRGYCFAGASGAGKSTLATSLSSNPSVTVLGEDQVIVRRLDGRFWIFGTPWHTNPALCSPHGAPLDKLFFLDRSGGYGIKPLRPVDGIVRLLQTAFIPYYRPAAVAKILDRLG